VNLSLPAGVVPCGECTHSRAVHKHGGACGISACGCEVFAPPITASSEPENRGSRRIAVDVPDGYLVRIELVPITVDDSAEHGA